MAIKHKINGNNILYKDLIVPIPENLHNAMIESFTEQTHKYTLDNFRKIGQTADKLLKQLLIFEKWFKDIQSKVLILSKGQRASLTRQLNLNHNIIAWEALLKDCYAFVQKTRKFFTGETLQYIFYFDESLTKNNKEKENSHSEDKIGIYNLEQMLDTVSLAISFGSETTVKLRINQQDKLRNLYENITAIEDYQAKIINNFQNILKARQSYKTRIKQYIEQNSHLSEKQKKDMLSAAYTNRGFVAEAAITLTDSTIDLIKAYKQDTEAFWRGGDLQRGIDNTPSDLVAKYNNTNFEVKRLSATAEKSIGANLTSLTGLITALTTISNILNNSNLTRREINKFIKTFLFKANFNINRETAEKMAKISARELNDMLKF